MLRRKRPSGPKNVLASWTSREKGAPRKELQDNIAPKVRTRGSSYTYLEGRSLEIQAAEILKKKVLGGKFRVWKVSSGTNKNHL